MGTLAFRNAVQAKLFEEELRGQISDGHWENATPDGHWVPWCHATVIVDPANLGRDFHVNRDYYGFSSPFLFSCVGDRMLAIARTIRPDITEKQLKRELRDMAKIVRMERKEPPVQSSILVV